MNQQQKNSLLADLCGIANQSTSEPLASHALGISWEAADRVFTLPEPAAHAFLALVGSLARQREWSKRFSEEHINRRLLTILKRAREDGRESAKHLLDDLIAELESYSVERTVYVPVQGLSLSVSTLEIGQVMFRTVDDEVLAGLTTLIDSIYTEPDGSLPDREYMEYRHKQIKDRLAGKVCAEFRTIAEPVRARERAEDETRRALEVLTFANATLHPFHPRADAVVCLDGELPTARPWVAVVSDDSFHDVHRRAPTSWLIEITSAGLEHLEEVGALALSDLLALPDDQLTEFDQALLRAVHWFGASQAQVELENRLLNMMTCLETLLSPKDGRGIASTVAEGVAVITARQQEHRERVRKFVRSTYRARSGISHGGAKFVAEADVMELRWIVSTLITTLISWRAALMTRDDLLTWVELAKSNTGVTNPPVAPDRVKTLHELREEQGWSQQELASRVGVDVSTINRWENGTAQPNAVDLRRLAGALSVQPEDIKISPKDRWLNVEGHRFHLTARREAPGRWVARVGGWDDADAVAWPHRPVDPSHPDVDSPAVMLTGGWQATGATAGRALAAVAVRVTNAMERALCPQRLPDDPQDWQPLEPSEHWRRRHAAGQRCRG